MTVENLTENTSYNVTASIFTSNLEYRHLTAMKTFKTLDSNDYIPQTIPNNTITVNVTPDQNATGLIATIKWQPTEGGHTHFNTIP